MPSSTPLQDSAPLSAAARRRRNGGNEESPGKRLFYFTDLRRQAGRRLMAALDDRLASATRHPWRLSVRDLSDLDSASTTAYPADAIIVDSDLREQILGCQIDGCRVIATPVTPIADLSIPQLCIDQQLAGMAAADVILRLGYRRFDWSGSASCKASPLVAGFHEEAARVELPETALGSHHDPAAKSEADGPRAILSDQLPSSNGENPVISVARSVNENPSSHTLIIEPSAHWSALALVGWLNNSASTSAQPPLPSIPPRPIDDTQVARLPRSFADPGIAAASEFIDQRLIGGSPVNVEHLAAAVSIPRRTLERRFRETLGTSIHREITRRQVARARQHLLVAGATPAMASTAAGYPTTRMLSINFTKLCGISPRAFQRNCLAPFR